MSEPKKERKRGQLSTEEMDYIRNNCRTMSIEDIAEHINRNPDPVIRYIEENNLISAEYSDEQREFRELRRKLHSRLYWEEIKLQLTDSELQYFEWSWCQMVRQFREDVTPTEELQINQWITLNVLINRSMKERKRHLEDIERIQKTLNKEYAKPAGIRDDDLIVDIESQLAQARSALGAYTQEHTKLSEQSQKLAKDLKTTRDQRLQKIEDGKSTWGGLLKMLQDEEIKHREGREMEIRRLAAEKAKNDLSQFYTYADGKIDQPLLNADTVMEEE